MQIDDWLRAACDDAERRGLAELKPLLESLARSTAALREMDRSIRMRGDAISLPGTPDSGAEADLPR
jgi:hypothetical protein